MKINVTHTDRLEKAIEKHQKGASARCITLEDVTDAVETVERRLSKLLYKKNWVGVRVEVNVHAQRFPASYNYTPYSTTFVLLRGANSWYVTAVHRDVCRTCGIWWSNAEDFAVALAAFQLRSDWA